MQRQAAGGRRDGEELGRGSRPPSAAAARRPPPRRIAHRSHSATARAQPRPAFGASTTPIGCCRSSRTHSGLFGGFQAGARGARGWFLSGAEGEGGASGLVRVRAEPKAGPARAQSHLNEGRRTSHRHQRRNHAPAARHRGSGKLERREEEEGEGESRGGKVVVNGLSLPSVKGSRGARRRARGSMESARGSNQNTGSGCLVFV